MIMKKILICTMLLLSLYTPKVYSRPISDIYKQGVYDIDESNIIIKLTLETDKPTSIMLFGPNNELVLYDKMYYRKEIKFDSSSNNISTVSIVGDGEVSIIFERR